MSTHALLEDFERTIAVYEDVICKSREKNVTFEVWQTAVFQSLRFQIGKEILKRYENGNEAEFIKAIRDESTRNEIIHFLNAPHAGLILSLDALSEAMWVLNCELRVLPIDSC